MIRGGIDERGPDILSLELLQFRLQRVHVHAINVVHRHTDDIRLEMPHDAEGATVSVFLCQHRVARGDQRSKHQFKCLHGAGGNRDIIYREWDAFAPLKPHCGKFAQPAVAGFARVVHQVTAEFAECLLTRGDEPFRWKSVRVWPAARKRKIFHGCSPFKSRLTFIIAESAKKDKYEL